MGYKNIVIYIKFLPQFLYQRFSWNSIQQVLRFLHRKRDKSFIEKWSNLIKLFLIMKN